MEIIIIRFFNVEIDLRLQYSSFNTCLAISFQSAYCCFSSMHIQLLLFDTLVAPPFQCCFLDLSKVYGFKPHIFVCPNFLYEKTHLLLLHMKRCIVWILFLKCLWLLCLQYFPIIFFDNKIWEANFELVRSFKLWWQIQLQA